VNISQALLLIRDRLDDPAGTKYSDAEIVRHLDEQARVMFRKQTQTSKDWHNFGLMIQKEDGRQLFADTWEWRLPTWIDRVVRVFERGGTATAESTFSPYLWTGNSNITFGREIQKTDPERRDGWSWEGQHTFRLWRRTEALELIILCCKVPAPSLKVKLLHAYADATGAYLPPTTDSTSWIYGSTALEEGVYVNAEMQVTTTAVNTATHLGDIRRVSYSQPDAIDSAVRYQALRFESSFTNTLAVGDYIETMLPVPDAHANLLILLTLNAIFVKKNNTDGMKAIVADLSKEWQDFIMFATMPRDSSGPFYKVSATSQTRRSLTDTWPSFGRWI
jgi:hypothetical protein